MTDTELNIALHDLLPREDRRSYIIAHAYCHDPAWCVEMMEKYKLDAIWNNESYEIYDNPECSIESSDPSLTRAVALAVLALLQRKDGA